MPEYIIKMYKTAEKDYEELKRKGMKDKADSDPHSAVTGSVQKPTQIRRTVGPVQRHILTQT